MYSLSLFVIIRGHTSYFSEPFDPSVSQQEIK